jgi:hypothetical protein
MERRLTVAEIFGETGRLANDNAGMVVACVFGLTLLNVVLDIVMPGNASTLPATLANLGAQYGLITLVLTGRGLREGTAGFGAFFGINFLAGLGIMLGIVLLVVPGLFLAARWSAANAALLSEGEGVNAALGRSWDMTAASVWPIVGVQLVIFVPALVIGFGSMFALDTLMPVAGSAIMYLALFAASTLSWLAGVAIYTLLRPATDELAEVFA